VEIERFRRAMKASTSPYCMRRMALRKRGATGARMDCCKAASFQERRAHRPGLDLADLEEWLAVLGSRMCSLRRRMTWRR